MCHFISLLRVNGKIQLWKFAYQPKILWPIYYKKRYLNNALLLDVQSGSKELIYMEAMIEDAHTVAFDLNIGNFGQKCAGSQNYMFVYHKILKFIYRKILAYVNNIAKKGKLRIDGIHKT